MACRIELGPAGRRCCRIFILFMYYDDSALFPDVRDKAVGVGVVANVC